MRFVKVTFFPMKFYKKVYLHGKFFTKFCLFLLLDMFPWMNKFLITEKIFLPCLTKQEIFRSSHCIFQSFSAMNTHSIKIVRRSVVKVLITLLIKQEFVATCGLVFNEIFDEYS